VIGFLAAGPAQVTAVVGAAHSVAKAQLHDRERSAKIIRDEQAAIVERAFYATGEALLWILLA